MKKEDMLQTLSFLALKMENSGTQLLEAIAPKSLIHLDPVSESALYTIYLWMILE